MSNSPTFAIAQVSPFQVVQTFFGGLPPEPVIWPDGAATHGVTAGIAHGPWMLASVVTTPPSPSPTQFFTLAASVPSLNGTTVVFNQTWTTLPLSQVQTSLLLLLEAQAENQRQAIFPMVGPLGALVLQRKFTEALNFAVNSAIASTNFPILNACVGIEAGTIQGVALLANMTASTWYSAMGAIEANRLQVEIVIRNATSALGAISAFNAVTWNTTSTLSTTMPI